MRRLINWLLEIICYLQSVGCTRREMQARIAAEEKYLLFLRNQCYKATSDYERLTSVKELAEPTSEVEEDPLTEEAYKYDEAYEGKRVAYLRLIPPREAFDALLGDVEVDL